jgi:hypothetical protein
LKQPPSEACADHVPRPPTRAFANTTEPAKPAVKGSKITEPPRICTAPPPTANRRARLSKRWVPSSGSDRA